MNSKKQKYSLRGSLAGDVAKIINSSTPSILISEMIKDFLRLNRKDILVIHDNDLIIMGKKSDLGKYLPDW
jgi:hypothetical protein